MASTQYQTAAARETDVDVNPDSGLLGDLHAAGCRAELWRMADALGAARAVRVLGEDTPRAIAREPIETAAGNVTFDWILRESVRGCLRSQCAECRAGEEQMGNWASCRAVERRAVSPSAAQGVPNG